MNIPDNSPAVATDLDAQRFSPLLTRLTALTRISDLGIALGLLLFCFITRLIAIPASLWEWDDILFARALHNYDLATHSPHPPGFPVFVAMARVAYWIFKDEHLALSTVSLIFASLLAPALFYFYREIFCDRRIAFAGALLGSFAPSVWVHSGAGRSDEVALTLGIIGLTLAIHGLQSQRSLIAGCAVFGLSMGVRVTLLPVMGPVIALVFLARLRRREWRPVVAALAAGTICFLIWWVPFIYRVTWKTFRFVMDTHSQFAWENDAIFADTENGVLSYRLRRFFIEVWGARWIAWAIYTFSALGLFALVFKRRWKVIGWMALAFLPFLIFTLILNTPLSAPLYSLPYIPLFIGLAACGLVMVPGLIFTGSRWSALKNIGLFLAVGLTIGIAEWTYPAIKLLHREVSPPVRASHYLQQTLDHQRDLLYIDGYFAPHASFYLPDSKIFLRDEEFIPEANLIGTITGWPRFIGLTSDPIYGGGGKSFSWPASNRGARRLRLLSLGRYFEAYVNDITKMRGITFLSGWYQHERDDTKTWRWMSRKGKVGLLGIADAMTLRVRGLAAIQPKSKHPPTLVFRFNGVEVDRFTPTGSPVDRTLVLKLDPSRLWSALEIETDQVINPLRDASFPDDRDLGLQCFALDWLPAPGAPINIKSLDQYLGTGWYALENSYYDYWRWTSGVATANLPAIYGEARMDLKMLVAQRTDRSIPEVKVEIGGNVLEKFQPGPGLFTKTYYVPHSIHHGTQAELKLSAPAVLSEDPRALAMQIYYLGWRPSEKN